MCQRIVDELCGIDLGDRRLEERSQRIMETLAADPQASINAACLTWADTIAAYRFFDNSKVSPEAILEPHYAATLERIRGHNVVLVLQDTTELDFTPHPPADAGCLNKADRFGLYDHTHLAVTPERLCLGVVGVTLFDRTAESLGQTRERRTLPIEQKESFRWLEGFRLASRLAGEVPDTQIISVADREGDLYDIFVEAGEDAAAADFVIRAKNKHCTLQRDSDRGPAGYQRVSDAVRDSEVRLQRTVSLPQTPKRAARQATLQVRARPVTIRPPHARSSLPPVNVNIVHVEEAGGPGDGTDVEWLLITSLPVETSDAIERVIDYYAARWTIEVYFRVLKSGCRVEQLQLETTSRVKNCLAFYQIIAWRVLSVTALNRECPDLPCSAVFTAAEWKSVWQVTTRSKPPTSAPPLSEFVALLATLGGHNNRSRDAPPGPQTLWTALRRMTDFATAWITFRPD